MNKTKIEWCDSTWNPVTGCLHGCEYCYARRIAERFGKKVPDFSGYPISHGVGHMVDNKFDSNPYPFLFEPTFHAYRLDEPQRKSKPQTIFVCSMADLFGDWVPCEWIEEVFAACKKAPQHRYLFLTKNPERYTSLAMAGILPEEENFWYGSSAPTPETPFWWSRLHNTFASIEPMIGSFAKSPCMCSTLNWVILGAMTGPGSKQHQPKREWVENVVESAQAAGVPVFMKDSLLPIMGEENMRREWPWEKVEGPSITVTDEELNRDAEEIAHEMGLAPAPETSFTRQEPKWAQNFRQRFEKVE